MNFEGTEKKFELWIRPGSIDLRSLGHSFWGEVVAAARAKILSRCSHDSCDAYLLSESSLFVYAEKVLMITCGTTNLPNAVLKLLDRVPIEVFENFIYERKNEVFPHEQPSSFTDDANLLNQVMDGRAFQFGPQDEHHLFVYHLDSAAPKLPDRDVTVEMLMYGLHAEICQEFQGRPQTGESALDRIGLGAVLDGHAIDEHFFSPSGYSMNAIRDDHYVTMHVTPEERGSYASFETNGSFGGDVQAAVLPILEVFRPRSFDWIVWERGTHITLDVDGYPRRSEFSRDLNCGYRVRFLRFGRETSGVQQAEEIPLTRRRATQS